MIEAVESFLKKQDLTNSCNVFIIGFSGGFDSLSLLDIMSKLSEKYGFKIVVAHLNHNWRGNESLEEQNRCKDFAKQYNVDFITETLSDDFKISESVAREARYGFFERCTKNFNNVYVLTAHNASDNAETLIYRIVKGTGISGLEGIPEKINKNGITYLRPLLNCSRKKIEAYCKVNNLIPNQDSSNMNLKYSRNYLRYEIMPKLNKINPNMENAINSLSEIAKETEFILNEIVSKNFDADDNILYEDFKNSSKFLKKFILHRFCIRKNLDYDKKKILEMLDFVCMPENINKKFSLTKNLWLIFDNTKIYTTSIRIKNNEVFEVKQNGEFKIPFGGVFVLSEFTTPIKIYPDAADFTAYVDLSNIKSGLVLRTRRNGDIIQPFGMSGKMKLKKYLISKKVPKNKRDELILLTKGNEVLWIIGVGLSDKIKVAKVPTHVVKYIQ